MDSKPRGMSFPLRIGSSCHIVVSVLSCLVLILQSGLVARADTSPLPQIKKIPHVKNLKTPHVVQGQVFVKYKESILQTDDPSQRINKILEAEKQLRLQLFPREDNVFSIRTYERIGAQLLRLPQGMSVEDAITKLTLNRRLVEFAEPNYKIYPLYRSPPPNDDMWVNSPIALWGMEKIGMPSAWRLSEGTVDKNVIVAVLDTGIDYGHPDLEPQIWRNVKEDQGVTNYDDDHNGIKDDIYGATFCNGASSPDPQDDSGHGTLIAGVIGARHNTSHIAGINRHIKIMALKIMCIPPGGKLPEGDIGNAIAAIEYAINNEATVLNASWVYGDVPHLNLKLAIEDAGEANALFVAAAGNSSSPQNNNDVNPVYPASFGKDGVPNVLAVAGTMLKCRGQGELPYSGSCDDGSTPDELHYDESNYGETSVHMAAPSWYTISTHLIAYSDGLGLGSGTSMAAAHLSGCAALLHAARRANSSSSPLSVIDLKHTLMTTGDQLSDLDKKVVDGRRLNCFNALRTEIPNLSIWSWIKKIWRTRIRRLPDPPPFSPPPHQRPVFDNAE